MTDRPGTARTTVSVAVCGSGGAGVMTAGNMLLDAAAKAGWYGLMVRSSGPQIRGGEAAALLRFAPHPIDCLDDRFDALIAIDWQNIHRFADEIPLDAASLIVADPDQGTPPEAYLARGARCVNVPLKQLAKAIPGSWPNMVALGLAAELIGVPAEAVRQVVTKSLKKAGDTLAASLAAVDAGAKAAGEIGRRTRARARRPPGARRAGSSAATRPPASARSAAACGSCRLSDHARDRAARVALAGAVESRRRAGAGRGRACLDQHDHRRFVRRRSGVHRDRRPRTRAYDRGTRARPSRPRCRSSWST